ncbi:DUF6233 domain-containing protein [Streptomyces sp. NPDC053499]|uniref:DUF6233 domain-containing protein n=1 Tax=Streptomyces sp. NPDC053499 TaxID=3365707 RepID=UPI0037D94FF8
MRPPGGHGGTPWWQLHHRACWQARGGWRRRLVTTAEARQLLATECLPFRCRLPLYWSGLQLLALATPRPSM